MFSPTLRPFGLPAIHVLNFFRKSKLRSLPSALHLGFLLATFSITPFLGAEESPLLPPHRILPADPDLCPLKVIPDQKDWTYAIGAPASLQVRLELQPYPSDGVPIRYQLGPDMLEGPEKTAVVPAEGLKLPVPSPAQPGFIRCLVTATVEGKPVKQLATLGFAPAQIRPTQSEPTDFDSFWGTQKAALAKVQPDYRLEPAPAISSEKVEAFYLSFQNVGGWTGPSRFHGVLCVPKGPGPFPAVVNFPGAGVRPYTGNTGLAEKGIITLQVGIHGIPVNLAKEVYDQLHTGALDNYNRFNLDNRNSYYFRRVYLGCLRALDYVTTHPKWDGKNLVSMGGSQGGQLAISMAALEPRVTAVVASYPAYCDVSGYLHGRAGGWPGLFRPTSSGGTNDVPVEPKLLTTGYYDTLNFARRLKVPGIYFQGYNDVVCPPTSFFAMFSTITPPKEFVLGPERGHAWSASQQAPLDAWVYEHLGIH
jgi:cephalosporin-C deacetylase-like acetyl esterase